MKIAAIAPVLALALVACQPADTAAPPADAPAAPETPATPAAPADPWSVRSDGVGAITADTPFDEAAIRALYPDYTVVSEFLHEGDATTPIITISGQGDMAVEIQGDAGGTVRQVLVQGGDFSGPNGEALLGTLTEAGLAPADCGPGEGRFATQPVCRKADTPNLAWILSLPRYTGGDLPDPTTVNGRARLAGWLWTRP